MPRERTPRSRRRRGRRPQPGPGAAPPRPKTPTVATQQAAETPSEREPSVTRFSAHDYTYVRRELQRIVILAAAIIIAIVVLSFFLP